MGVRSDSDMHGLSNSGMLDDNDYNGNISDMKSRLSPLCYATYRRIRRGK